MQAVRQLAKKYSKLMENMQEKLDILASRNAELETFKDKFDISTSSLTSGSDEAGAKELLGNVEEIEDSQSVKQMKESLIALRG